MKVNVLLLFLCCFLLWVHSNEGAANLAVYTDSIVSPFSDWSWATTTDPSAGAFVYSGTHSYSWKPTNWDGVYFYCSACINPTVYSTLEFYINGGSASGEQITLALARYDGSTTSYPQAAKDITTYIGSPITQATWKKVTVPLSSFPSGTYDGIVLQANSAATQPTVYLDAMQLVAIATTPAPTIKPTPPPTSPPTSSPTTKPTTKPTSAPTSAPTTKPTSAPTSAPPSGTCSNTIKIAGTCSWAAGVNLPWNDYGRDFGTNAWGHDGVSVTSSTITTDLTNIHNYHARVVRWWLFSDLRAGVTFDASGTPTGLDSYVFPDLDAMLSIAAQQNIYVVLSLLDFEMANKVQVVNGVQTGGRASVISDATKRAALINNVIAPVLSRYGTNANILAWEIMNEPEWVVSDLPQDALDTSTVDPIPRAAFWDFCSSVISLVHTTTNQQVTIGSASLKWYRVWTPAYSAQYGLPTLNFDFYQSHYYSWMDPYCITNDPDLGTVCMNPLHQPVSGLALSGKAMVIGELVASTNVSGIFSQLLNEGYAGAWPWGYTQTSDFPIDWTAYTSWTASHQSIIHW